MPPLYILRHGETRWNREGRLQGRRDSALTALGQVQAARQGAILRGISGRLDVRCSPLGRTRRSAALAGLAVTVDDRLAEVALGDWEGRTLAEIAPPPGVRWKFDAPGGEGLASVRDRLDALLRDVAGPTVLVTHGVIAVLLRARLTGRSDAALDAMDDPQGVVHLLCDGRETVLR